MKKYVLALGLAACPLALTTTPALAQQSEAEAIAPAKVALAQQIVDLGYPEADREEMFFAAMDQMMAQMRQATMGSLDVEDAGAIAVLDTWLDEYSLETKDVLRSHLPSIMNGIVLAYANMFTHEELSDILDFVSTPSGQRFLKLSPAILAEPNFAAANQAYMDEVMASLPAAQAVLRDRIIDYFANKAENQTNES